MNGAPSTPASTPHSNSAAEDVPRPDCSVIVPVYNHWALVPEFLDCLYSQTLSQDAFEVLLVDNGSSDFAPPDKLPTNVRILHCETPGSYAARNVGIAAAAGDWLAFTDADCRPAPRWLEAIVERTRQEDGPILQAGPVEMYSDSANPNAYEIYDLVRGIPQRHYVRRGYAATANLLVHRAVADALSGFDAQRYSGGDADFCRRAAAQGYAIRFAPEAVVYHPARKSWSEVLNKARRIKGGQVRSGAWSSRAYWVLRTLVPPVNLYCRYMLARQHPLRYRLVSLVIQSRVWGYEVLETMRLLIQREKRVR